MTNGVSSLSRAPELALPARVSAANSTIRDSSNSRSRQYGRSLQILVARDVAKLEVFYLGLDFDDRRARFGGGVSDESILTYCRTLDWRNTIVIARGGFQLFDTVLEIHPLTKDWSEAEISITCPLACERSHIFAELLQLAALKAGAHGCKSFMLHSPSAATDLITVVHCIGRVNRSSDFLRVDIADYADASTKSANAANDGRPIMTLST